MPNSDDYQDERDRFKTERNDYRESNRENGNYNRNDNYKRKREESDGYNNNRNGYNSNPPKKPIDFNAPVVYTFKVSIPFIFVFRFLSMNFLKSKR